MSQARRTVEAIQAAHESIKTATNAAGQHSSRGEGSTFPQDIKDLYDLVCAMEILQYLTRDLAKVVKSFADDVRKHYVHGYTPDSERWPVTVQDAAADADQTLSKLRGYLERTPVHAGYNALAVLHGFVQNLHRVQR